MVINFHSTFSQRVCEAQGYSNSISNESVHVGTEGTHLHQSRTICIYGSGIGKEEHVEIYVPHYLESHSLRLRVYFIL